MRNGSFESRRFNRLRKNPFGLSFRGAAGDEESRKSFTFRARFFASLGMTRLRGVFAQPVRLLILGSTARRSRNQIETLLGKPLTRSKPLFMHLS
jgi:hypothetical protein